PSSSGCCLYCSAIAALSRSARWRARTRPISSAPSCSSKAIACSVTTGWQGGPRGRAALTSDNDQPAASGGGGLLDAVLEDPEEPLGSRGHLVLDGVDVHRHGVGALLLVGGRG